MRRLSLLPLAALCVLSSSSVVVSQSPPLTPFRGLIDHVSVNDGGSVPYQPVEISHGAISGDGRWVVMNSVSPSLTTGVYDDFNGYDDVFLRDRTTGWTWRISRAANGGDANGISQMATISTNARHIAFASGATNLVAADTNNRWDVFVHDLDQQRTVRVSVATDGTQGEQDSYMPSISADGRFVAFVSWATTFVPGVPPSSPRQVYLHDRDADGDGLFDEPDQVTTELVSVGITGGIADDSADSPRVSADGRVVFESAARNLTADGNPNWSNHLYLRDRVANQTTIIDSAITGGPSAWGVDYGQSDITDDGRFIVFSSISHDIVPFDMNWNSQVFRYDTAAGPSGTVIVTRLPDGTVGDGVSYATSISGDGRYVLFTTETANLASPPPGATGPAMLAVRDMLDGTFARVDVLDSGEPFDRADYYYTAAISADGSAIVLQTRSDDAIDGETFDVSHVVVMAALSATPESASYPIEGGYGSIEVNTSPVSGWSTSSSPWIVVVDGSGFGSGPRIVQYWVEANNTGGRREGWVQVGSKRIVIRQDGTTDTTPPMVAPAIFGTVGDNGWFVSDATVMFHYEDPESSIISTTGCEQVTQTTDTAGTTFTCTVTSEGGTASASVTVQRDTTPPGGTISLPYNEYLHKRNIYYAADYACADTTSGIESCTGPVPDGGPLPTSVPGRYTFDVLARDRAGNIGLISRPYSVSSGVCEPRPQGLVGWWPGDSHYRDIIYRNDGSIVNGSPLFYSSPYSMAFAFTANRYMWVQDTPTLRMDDAFTLSAWVYQVRDWLAPYAVIAGREGEYLLARGPNGNVHYSIATASPGWGWIDSGVRIERERWTKLALTYDGSAIRLYKNGQLAHERAASGVIGDAAPFQNAFQVAARQSAEPSYFDGAIDDVQLIDRALSAAEIEAAYFSADFGMCALTSILEFVPVPQHATFGGSAELVARLSNDQGGPMPGEQIQFTFRNVSVGTAVTNPAGVARIPVSIAGLSAQTLANAAQAVHAATAYVKYSAASSDFIIDKASPEITWNAPGSIVYGTALSATQLNATANVAGTFAYSPAAGATLPAGTHNLSVTFTPSSLNYTPATSTVSLAVNKATPTVTATGGTFTYDDQPHAGSGSATGVFGEALTPVALTYNGSSSTPPTQPGTHSVRASYGGSLNYLAGESTATLTINRATPTVEIDATPVWYTGYARTATVTVRGVNGVELYPYTLRYNGSTSAPANAGTYALEVHFAGNANYEPVTATGSFVIKKNFPIFPTLNDINGGYDGNPWGVNAVVIGVMNEVLPTTTTYNGSPDAPVNAGVYNAVVRFDGSDNYEADSRTFTVTIAKAIPFPQWDNLASIVYGTPLGPNQLNATVDVPGTFEYSPPAGTILDAGSHTLTATFMPADPQNYESRTITESIYVSRREIQPTWARPADIVYGTPLGAAQLNATAPVPGTFAYTPAAGTVLPAGVDHVLQVTFTPDDLANNYGTSAVARVTVLKATPTVTWTAPADLVYGTALSASQLNATSDIPGTFTYSPAAGAVLNAGTQTLSLTFTPDDAANYESSTATVALNVTKAASTIDWSNPADIVYGATLGAAELNATANVPGTFSYSPEAGSLLSAGSHTLSVTFTPDDAANHAGSTATVSLNVTKAASTINWSNPVDIVYGTALSAAQLNATANVAGSFAYAPAAGTVLDAGAHQLTVTFTPDDTVNYASATATSTLVVAKATPVVTWSNPASIVYGTPLSSTQLNATANVPGSFIYTVPAASELDAGTHELLVTFAPTDGVNYETVSRAVSIVITPATLTVRTDDAAKVYGQALPGFTATGSGFVNGDSMPSLSGALTFSTAATATSAPGSYSVTPSGVSSSNYTVTFVAGTLTVNEASTSLTLTTTPNPSHNNQTVQLRAEVSAVAPGAGVATGTVEFRENGTLLGTATLVNGVATMTKNFKRGTHPVTATYAGDANFTGSAGSVTHQTQ